MYDTAQERLSGGYYNGGVKSETNPGGMAKGGHKTSLLESYQDVGDVAKKVGDDAAVAAAAAAQSSAWLYEGTPGNVIRISDTQFAIKGVDRTSLYLNKPNPRALRLLQSKTSQILCSDNLLFNVANWTKNNTTTTDLNEPDPFAVASKATTFSETTGTAAVHNMTYSFSGYKANEFVIASFALKAKARNLGRVAIGTSGMANMISTSFNLSLGSTGAAALVGTAANGVAGIIPLGNSFYRVWVGGKLSTSDGAATLMLSLDNGTGLSYIGNVGSGIVVYDAAWHKLVAAPAQDNTYMFVQSAVWDSAKNATIVTVTGGYVSPNFGAYKDANTDGLYYGQDPNNAPRAGGAAGKIFMAQNFNAIGMNW